MIKEKDDQKKPKAPELKNPKKKIDRVYLCPNQTKLSFYIFILDKKGEKIPKLDGRGNHQYIGNMPVYQEKQCFFESHGGDVDNTLCSYELKADDPEYTQKLEALEKKRMDSSSWVMDQEMYEKYKNPDAAAAKIGLAKANAELKENRQKITAMAAEIEKLKREAAESK